MSGPRRSGPNEPLVNIVTAGPEHVDQVAPLLDDYRGFYKQKHDIAAARAFLGERLRNAESVVFLAISDGEGGPRAVGFTQLYPTFSSVSLARLWVLNDLYVSESHRARGVGRALMLHATEFARQSGAVRMTLSTAVDNATAKRLYETLGWARNVKYDHYSLTL